MSKTIERRIIDANIEVRTNPDGTTGVRGYAAVFDSPAYGETVTRSAFNRTIAQRDNIRFLINHDGTPLASTRAGTMTVGVDDHGLWFDIPTLDMENPKAREFASATGRGDMYQCSFAGYFNDTQVVDGLREVREVALIDVSGVTFPWYDATSMELTGDTGRSLLALRSLPAPARTSLLAQLLRAAPPGETSYGDVADAISEAATEQAGTYAYVVDLGDTWAVYATWDDDVFIYFQVDYTVDADGVAVIGDPVEVEAITEYRPVTAAESARSYPIVEARLLLGLDVAV